MSERQRIAIIGAGISGLTAAYLLNPHHDITIYEANDYAGGHTHTHDLNINGQQFRIDSGFIVFNPHHYPLFCRLLEQLGVQSQLTDMSFSVKNETSGLEYNAGTLAGLFCQARNIVSPRFWRMLLDLKRFYAEAPALLQMQEAGPTTAEYLAQNGYSQTFIDDHLVPIASALWSAPNKTIMEFPIRYMVQFFANHCMLQISGRPPWRVIKNGSSSYLPSLCNGFRERILLNTPVQQIRRDDTILILSEDGQQAEYDSVIIACHSDQALKLLAQPSQAETKILGAIRYQSNDVVLHSDTRLLPTRRKAWAAWNALVNEHSDSQCTVTYNMNILQGIQSSEDFLVTLNQTDQIDPSRVLKQMTYQHPIYSHQCIQAQQRRSEIQGQQSTYYCGAYWGWGFHEDGVRSAVEVARQFGVAFDA